jgi:hypothetical protein
LGVKNAGVSSDFWENCTIFKKISNGKRSFIGVCYISPENHCCGLPKCTCIKFASSVDDPSIL